MLRTCTVYYARYHWHDTRGKWLLARNPDGGWWHRCTSLKLFCLQPMVPWTVGLKILCPIPTPSFFDSFLLPSWRAVRSYRFNLEVRDPIWGDDWSHSLHRRVEVFRCFPQLPDLCTAPRSITLSLADRRHWHDTRGRWPLARNPDRSWWHRHINLKLFSPQPIAPWTWNQYYLQLQIEFAKLKFVNTISLINIHVKWETIHKKY